ncbi:MAG TPA: flagellar protein FliT [Candidatus Acetatifactor stercoripullorum]|uniref:Flagellar protein FliT n=1 Tax=Candidatus Acetatifactor stercoripullorum TaxID=2838414 RepID=A0A9D1R509_9FIRM|nr:flagellar protein FliT [uncultured Acetatifactor sp.]HIW81816.1 flagellar protein FliT [Candidatus Acetatifactor stercoripullorum]
METQLDILSETLDKKLLVLNKIQEYNKIQEQSFQNGQVRLQDFDEAVEQKGRLIEEINRLDEGFELLYERLAQELRENRQRYALQIKALQQKVARVTELSVAVQAQEQRNKKLVEDFFAGQKEQIGKNRKTSKAAYGYYKNMSGGNYVQPQFFDDKQ